MAYQSKAELLAEAQERGLDVGDDNTREEIIAALDDADNAAAAGNADVEAPGAPETASGAEAGGNLGYPHQPGAAPPTG